MKTRDESKEYTLPANHSECERRVPVGFGSRGPLGQLSRATQHAPQTTTTSSRGTTRKWSGSHRTHHHANGVLIVGSSNRGRVGEKGDQNLGQRNPQARGSCRNGSNVAFQAYKKTSEPPSGIIRPPYDAENEETTPTSSPSPPSPCDETSTRGDLSFAGVSCSCLGGCGQSGRVGRCGRGGWVRGEERVGSGHPQAALSIKKQGKVIHAQASCVASIVSYPFTKCLEGSL